MRSRGWVAAAVVFFAIAITAGAVSLSSSNPASARRTHDALRSPPGASGPWPSATSTPASEGPDVSTLVSLVSSAGTLWTGILSWLTYRREGEDRRRRLEEAQRQREREDRGRPARRRQG